MTMLSAQLRASTLEVNTGTTEPVWVKESWILRSVGKGNYVLIFVLG